MSQFLVFHVQDVEERTYTVFATQTKAREIGVVEAADPFDAIKRVAFEKNGWVKSGEWLAIPAEGALRIALTIEATSLDEGESKAKVIS